MSSILSEEKENLPLSPALSAKQYSCSSTLGSTMFAGATFKNCNFKICHSPVETRLQPAKQRRFMFHDSDEE